MQINWKLAVLLFTLLASCASTTNKTNHEKEPNGNGSHSKKLMEQFFEKYMKYKTGASQLCKILQKVEACRTDRGHDDHLHNEEQTEYHSHEDEDETHLNDHNDDKDENDDHEDNHNHKNKDDNDHKDSKNDNHDHEDNHKDDHDNEETKHEGKCKDFNEILKEHHTLDKEINEKKFKEICPAVFAILVSKIDQRKNENHEGKDHKLTTGEVWGYAIAAIAIISLSSLMVIVVIPLLGKSFYNKLMSFLVALAIGCLAGDALLHLIPHSLIPHSEHNHDEGGNDEKETLWRAFVIFVGIYMFFIVECCMKLKLARRKKSENRVHYGVGKQQLQHIADTSETARLSLAAEATKDSENLEPSRKSMNTFMMEVTSGNRRSSRQVRDSLWMAYMAAMDNGDIKSFHEENLPSPIIPKEQYRSDRESFTGRKIDTLRENSKEDLLSEIHESEHKHGSLESSANSKECSEDVKQNNNHPKMSNTSDQHRGHSHAEKEFDSTTKIASLAWMVIVGDGFHNLADGLAVGAAFSASFTNGISTAIAVFCHELPHELGDFAVLVKSGMTVKQAITYNMISGLISFLGMIGGILIGSNESSIVWVLAITAGMFLYISLVDMLPELCTQLAEEDFKTGLWTFFYQNLGILSGVFIMYLISLME
ncbi:metal cation symporter ZIP14-like [Xenia sp. Carnegie-2017]|uniref:metal cation symporter ZIP14-like n=1 Tax=Xenia sp. Carnegie-2017 TaxID=2897299 RepID=UPI001F037972|nr:metal cation symporter ZIP14-like [Xenia sp. Carnegie-2017]XP_046862534.1 metal cation symporter ZIP14-like [Xenia sp. Carnegie-2017]